MRVPTYAFVVLVTIFISSCTPFPTVSVSVPLPKANTSKSQYIYKSPENNKRVIVFVHGIFGDAIKTWKNSNGKYFFDFVKEDRDVFDKTDIYAYGFDSEYFGGRFTIDQIAASMNSRLLNDGIFNYDRIIFVNHSLGGLVTMKLLLKYPQYSKQVPLIFFFATPQEGAAIANIADRLLSNSSLMDMFPFDQNEFLSELDGDWKNKIKDKSINTIINCAYETQVTTIGMLGVLVVPRSSATRYCDGESMPINENHISIVKPASWESDSYIALRNAVRAINADKEYPTPEMTKPKSNTRWDGIWKSEDGYEFSFALHLTISGDDKADGYILWRLRHVPPNSALVGRINEPGNEFVHGSIDRKTGELTLVGSRVDNATLLAPDNYRFFISSDGRNFRGLSKNNDGSWRTAINGVLSIDNQ
jgi:hypothetical protein